MHQSALALGWLASGDGRLGAEGRQHSPSGWLYGDSDTLRHMSANLVELRAPAFKSLQEAEVPLEHLTLLIGRNGSGKSNVLDALAVLSALSSGVSIRDALDGGREGPLIRGGSEGCAPTGTDSFAVGCSARIDGTVYKLDVEISVRPTVQVMSERLWTTRTSGPRRGEARDLLKSEAPQRDSGDIVARWDSGRRGPNPPLTFRATQLLTTQIATRVPATSQAGREVRRISDQMLAVLSRVFILDPVPHQMRDYVQEKDTQLRRSAANLSAALARLLGDETTRTTLLEMTQSLSEAQIEQLATVNSELGDVMVTIREQIGAEIRPVPARLMSDGTLRFLAIAAALMERSRPLDDLEDPGDGRQLVVEEIENGLHPSQAALLLNQLKASAATGVRTLATTHSPAILDALSGDDHSNVVVCSRDSDGWSRATRLTDFGDYFEVVARGPLGSAAVNDRLRPGTATGESGPSLAEVLGL